MKTFVIADTYLNYENIIKYCNRPFKDTFEMNEYIISKWNSVVSDEDTVYHLGDFGFGDNEEISRLVKSLNGNKILVIGNHDLRRSKNTWIKLGFMEVYKSNLVINNIILSHYPIEISEEKVNIFGHIHDKPLSDNFDNINHFCVSCEVVDYTPILLDDILKKLS